jgi:hypothetical protein
MTTDDPSTVPQTDPEKNSADSGQNGTFGDIDPSYQLYPSQCRAIELALAGSPNAHGLR